MAAFLTSKVKKKKITQLTHPVLGNYGGILQCYALQQVLLSLGIDTKNLKYTPTYIEKIVHSKKEKIKALIRLLFLNLGIKWKCKSIPILLQNKIGISFEKKHIKSLEEGEDMAEAYVVGSDQVWRPVYTRPMKDTAYYFLSFANTSQRQNSIAYAASFGVDEWEGTPEETKICKKLLKDFKAISVREHSGVDICKKIFGVEAVQMPDPTLLLTKEHYANLVAEEKTWCPRENFLASYILDNTKDKKIFIEQISNQFGLYHQELMSHPSAAHRKDRLPKSVSQWLRLIRDCEYLITDSFHGCVFAIIFNKPFLCLGNKSRGNSRFNSLLSTYGLNARLISCLDIVLALNILNHPINWNIINEIKLQEREKAFSFLKAHLL